MKTKTKVISIVLSISALIMLVSCQQQKVEWKGIIKEVNGIKVVNNPKEPLYGEVKFELREDLSIGNEKDENSLFYGIVDIALDSQDNIYALEYRNNRIQKFNKDGKYLQTIGRKGQGPGELQSPFQILLDSEDNIYINDDRKIKCFDKEGNSFKEIILRNRIIDFLLNSKGNFLIRTNKASESGHICYFDEVDRKGETVKTIAKFQYGLTRPRGGSLNWVVTFPYVYNLLVTSINAQTFVYGYSKEYKLSIVNEEGRVLFNIAKKETPRRISEKEQNNRKNEHKNLPESVRKSIEFPPHRPFFSRLMCDDQARIYVVKMKSVLDNKYPLEIDIFNKDGYYLYKTEIPLSPYVIKEGYLYTKMSSKEKGEELIKRFRIINWEQIKKGI